MTHIVNLDLICSHRYLTIFLILHISQHQIAENVLFMIYYTIKIDRMANDDIINQQSIFIITDLCLKLLLCL